MLALGELEALPPGLSPLAAVREATARSVARFTVEDGERLVLGDHGPDDGGAGDLGPRPG